MAELLTQRWYPLRQHSGQTAYFNSPHRFNVLPCGRRSGKTECAKRKLVSRAFKGSEYIRPKFFAAAPTRDQAKIIYWDDLKSMVPAEFTADVRETDLSIKLTTGTEIRVVGMDKPQRIEGTPWDGGILDEYANMKPDAWEANILPALADRNGWCDLIGVPEGRNHYFATYNRAVADMASLGSASNWGAFTWHSDTVLNATEKGRAFLAEALRTMSLRHYMQEFQASFESYAGQVLYAFKREDNVKTCKYDPNKPIHIGMDFNINPMSATVWQEDGEVSNQIAEVIIPTSDTDEMSKEIIRIYARGGSVSHITIYPDPAGAQSRTSAQGKTDISILRSYGFKVSAMSSHPLVRDRLVCTNSRFTNAKGEHRAFVDPTCVKSIEAYERHEYKPGTGNPDKSKGYDHPVDATGYYMFVRFDGNVGKQVKLIGF